VLIIIVEAKRSFTGEGAKTDGCLGQQQGGMKGTFFYGFTTTGVHWETDGSPFSMTEELRTWFREREVG